MIPFLSIFRRKIRKTPENAGKIRSLFSRFQTILDMNTRILEKMIEMERMLGGEYIFDRTFLENSVNEVGPLVYQVVYSLNAMTDNRFPELFDTFQNIRGCLDDILAGGLGPYAGRLTLSCPAIRMEMQSLVGSSSSNLAELEHHTGLHTPDGFALTTTGMDAFMRHGDLQSGIARMVADPMTPDLRERIETLVQGADIPDALGKAVDREIRKLSDRSGKPSRLWVSAETVEAEGAGRSSRVFRVEPHAIWEGIRKSIADSLGDAAENRPETLREGGPAMAVFIQARPRSILSGSVLTMDPLYGSRQVARVNVFGDGPSESFLVYRFYPFDPVESAIRPKETGEILPDRKKSLSLMPGGLRRGSALIRKGSLVTLVESAMTVERTFGKPQTVSWSEDESGRITITGIEPLSSFTPDDVAMEDLTQQLEKATVLLEGGETAQMGVAAGRVVHVTEGEPLDAFPQGAIAVARTASPDLSPVLRRASGLVTETGSPIGHLSAIAREVRVPCIVGLKNAMDVLENGRVVTMDAGEGKVYQGVLELLARYRSSGVELYPTDPEYIILRQLLRWIIPLDLNDPDSPEFTSANCRTFHDIIHFAHEMAVEELLNIKERHKDLKGVSTRRLDLDIPMDLRVLMIEEGLADPEGKEWTMEDITSLPFLAYLKGLARSGMWDRRPASIGLKDIFSGMDRTYAALSNKPGYSGQNLAIVAENYLNLTLRMGYHFNVINAYLSENTNKNFIYFRFAGGFAYAERRKRRAGLIAAVLENMDFKVTVTGDLVVGKLKMAERKQVESALVRLGQLTAFTRQLDIRMDSDGDLESFMRDFYEKAGQENGGTGKINHQE
jgi:pyruvate,water dikinase